MRVFLALLIMFLVGCASVPMHERYVYTGSISNREAQTKFHCIKPECNVDVSKAEKQALIDFTKTLPMLYGHKFGISIYRRGGQYYFITRNLTLFPQGKLEFLKGWNEKEPKNKKLHELISEKSHVFKP